MNKMQGGFAISLEAFFSVFAFFIVLSTVSGFQAQSQADLRELYLLQKANDVLKVWSLKHELSRQELLSDLSFAFPQNCVVLKMNGIALNECKANFSFVSSKARIFDSLLQLQEIELIVYY